MFAKTPNDSLASLAKKLDKIISQNKSKKLAAVLNFTGKNTDEFRESIRKFAEKNGIKNIALTTTSTQSRFRVNPMADFTVMHYVGKRVRFNHAVKGMLSEKDIAKVAKGVNSILK
ncbi:MAG: hypothetical protein ACFCD0_25115 [Gemmataceae bacterium]